MNGGQQTLACGPAEPSKLWSMPWHARLKNLADTLRLSPEQALAAQVIARPAVTGAAGSWMGRARSRGLTLQFPSS